MIMSSLRTSTSCSNTSSKQRKQFAMERRPKLLKDFLSDDSNSFSSSGFRSFPRPVDDQDRHHSLRNLIQVDLDNARKTSKGLQRSRSKAASATISAFQALINSVKSIQFAAGKSPSILPQSLSRRLSKKSHHAQNKTVTEVRTITTVRIKDIIRWKSFRDLAEEKPQPPDHHLPSSPDHHTTTSTGSTDTSCSSNASSWCDSDFTSEYLPPWSGNSEENRSENAVIELGKKYSPCVGRDSMEATTKSPAISPVGPKDDLACEEKEQGSSPVSILDKWMSMEDNDDVCDCEEDEEEEIYGVEEKAKLLLNHVKETTDNSSLEEILLDFFVEELSTKRKRTRNGTDDEVDREIVRLARAWINGEHSGAMDSEACVREMDGKAERWSKFKVEEEEVGLQIENGVLNHLLDELLADLLLC